MHNHKLDRMMSYYAKMFIVISIALLSYGIILQIETTSKASTPSQEIEKEDNTKVTPINEELEKNPLFDDKKTAEKKEEDNPNLKLSTEEINENLRKELQKTYTISIYYGKETLGYKVSNSEFNIKSYPITDDTVINQQLNRLKTVLSHYPPELFKEIRKGGIPLSIYLINNYEDKTITGITDSTYEYAQISIAAIYPLEESFYHESYHYIERYLFKKGATFNSWDSLNPTDFQYGKVYGNLSYSQTFSANSSFVNNYAQTAAAEDRASTFEYMMAPSKASCLNKNTTVWSKARYVALTIETVLNSVKPNNIEYWERFL